MNPEDPNFNMDQFKEFLKVCIDDEEIDSWKRDRFSYCLVLLEEHKFWDSQPIMKGAEALPSKG